MEKKFPKALDYGKKIAYSIIALAALVALIVFVAGYITKTPRCSSPKRVELNICPGAEDIRVPSGSERSVAVRPDCWSGKISTPMDKYCDMSPGKYEIGFWTASGRRIATVRGYGPKNELGNIERMKYFRLRGKAGYVNLTVR